MASTEKIAITGGGGFLGSNMAKSLLRNGKEVVVIDNLSTGLNRNLDDFGIRQRLIGDLKDYEFARKALEGANTVYHFAADVGGVAHLHSSNARELSAMQTNLVIDSNVFRSCIENRVEHVIYASSVSVYSYKRQLGPGAVFKEEDSEKDINPEGGYGWAKYIGEQQLRLSNMKYGIARIFHAYGPNIGLSDDKAPVIGSFMKKVIKSPEKDLVVFGDGEQTRCFVYVDDVIDAMLRMRSYMERQDSSITVNIGTRDTVTINGLANAIIRLSGREIKVRHDSTQPVGTYSRMPDLERIGRLLDWRPTTDLEKGLGMTYDWALRRLSS